MLILKIFERQNTQLPLYSEFKFKATDKRQRNLFISLTVS